ncbi:MAG: hypothetical protein K8S23_01285 [Candidatus Cloacimonetes bacterium]|nr:hypothetical protein [Candidatus Cloacimonadota bacterium]
MRFYNLIVNFLYFVLFPFLFIFKRKEILARSVIDVPIQKKSIWIHGASVGEINAAVEFIPQISLKFPNNQIVVSTMTRTGLETAKRTFPKFPVFLYPLDLNFLIKNLLKRIDPVAIIILETEFWPNLLHFAQLYNIPIYIVNGRITKKSFKSYKNSLFFWRKLFKAIKKVGVQSEIDLKHYRELDFENVSITKNLKYSVSLPSFNRKDVRNKWNLNDEDFVIVFGSSRQEEEKILLNLFPILKSKIANLKIIICPRHLNRLVEIISVFQDHNYCLYSNIKNDFSTLIIDEMGILTQAYAVSDISLVGGSFYDFGGHNPLEPAFYHNAIVMGKYFSSCTDSVKKLQENGGIIISTIEDIKKNIIKIYKDPAYRKLLGENAKSVLSQNSDSLKKNLDLIEL